jgi:hypothetical protein
VDVLGDVLVGLRTAECDVAITCEIWTQGVYLSAVQLDPGVSTLAFEGTHVVPLVHLRSMKHVDIKFAGTSPSELILIWAIANNHIREGMAFSQHSITLMNGRNVVIKTDELCTRPPQEVQYLEEWRAKSCKSQRKQAVFLEELIQFSCHPDRLHQIE